MKKLTVIVSVLAFAACTTRLLVPNESDVERGKKMYPGYTLAELNEGKALYEAECAECHKLKSPSSESIKEWKEIVPVMAQRAKIDATAEQKILRYVTTMHDASKKGR